MFDALVIGAALSQRHSGRFQACLEQLPSRNHRGEAIIQRTPEEWSTMCYSSRRVNMTVIFAQLFSLCPVPSVFSFFEWKKNVVKTPYFIYQTEPLINEKHYPDVNVDKILQTIEKDKLPLLAMAGLFDVNRHCEVINEHEELFRTYSFSFSSLSKDGSLVFLHDLYSRCQWNDAKCTHSNAGRSIRPCRW